MMIQREENMIYGYRNKVKKSFRFLLYFRILKCIKQKSMFFYYSIALVYQLVLFSM